MMPTDEILVAKAVVLIPATADRDIPEILVQHGYGCGRVLDK